MEVVEKKEMVHKDVYESGEKEYASKGVAGTGLGLIYQVLIIVILYAKPEMDNQQLSFMFPQYLFVPIILYIFVY